MLRMRTLFTRLPALAEQIGRQPVQPFHLSAVDLKARKGTREKWAKLRKKHKAERLSEIIDVGFVPFNRKKERNIDKHMLNNDQDKEISKDDAYSDIHYQRPTFSFIDAVEAFKQTHHSTMLDAMHMPLNMTVEIDMSGVRDTKNVADFRRLVRLNYPFDHGQERAILFFAKDEKFLEEATNAGAKTVGGSDLIRSALKGNIRFADFEYILAHSDIMTEMLQLRGLLKRKFPSLKEQTVGTDARALVRSFLDGVLIEGKKDDFQRTFGSVNTSVGPLKMPTEQLIDNCTQILSTVNSQRPNRGGRFITRVFLGTSLVDERLRINPTDFPFADYERPIEEKVVKTSKKKGKINPNQIPREYKLFRVPE